MGIQDLGAIGEFISSIFIVVTFIVLIYEVRGTKKAALEANAQERQRKRDSALGAVVESPHLAAILVKMEQHLGNTGEADYALEFGSEPLEWRQARTHFTRMLANWQEAFESELPEQEPLRLDRNISLNLSDAGFRMSARVTSYSQEVEVRGGRFGQFRSTRRHKPSRNQRVSSR